MSNYLAREKYRDQAFAAALQGCKQDRKDEPVWWLGGAEAPSDIRSRCLAEIEELKRRKAMMKEKDNLNLRYNYDGR